MQELFELVEENVTTQELKKSNVITHRQWGNNVWQEAAQEGVLDMLQKTWECVDKKLTT